MALGGAASFPKTGPGGRGEKDSGGELFLLVRTGLRDYKDVYSALPGLG